MSVDVFHFISFFSFFHFDWETNILPCYTKYSCWEKSWSWRNLLWVLSSMVPDQTLMTFSYPYLSLLSVLTPTLLICTSTHSSVSFAFISTLYFPNKMDKRESICFLFFWFSILFYAASVFHFLSSRAVFCLSLRVTDNFRGISFYGCHSDTHACSHILSHKHAHTKVIPATSILYGESLG